MEQIISSNCTQFSCSWTSWMPTWNNQTSRKSQVQKLAHTQPREAPTRYPNIVIFVAPDRNKKARSPYKIAHQMMKIKRQWENCVYEIRLIYNINWIIDLTHDCVLVSSKVRNKYIFYFGILIFNQQHTNLAQLNLIKTLFPFRLECPTLFSTMFQQAELTRHPSERTRGLHGRRRENRHKWQAKFVKQIKLCSDLISLLSVLVSNESSRAPDMQRKSLTHLV